MARLPHNVTSAIATAVSSSSPPATSSIAATAEQGPGRRHTQQPPKQARSGERDRDGGDHDEGTARPQVEQLLQPQLQAKQHDGQAQEPV